MNRGKAERGGKRGRGEWTPVTLHANLTQPGCTTTMRGGGTNENEATREKRW